MMSIFLYRSDTYQYRALRFVDHRCVPWESTEDLWVIPEVVFHGADVHATRWPEPWAVFTRYHLQRPRDSTRPHSGHTGRRVRIDLDMLAALQAEFPWLTLAELEAMVNTKAAEKSGGGHGQGSASSSSSASAPQDPEAVFAAVNAELSAVGEQVAADQPEGELYFQVKIFVRDKSQTRFAGLCTDVGVAPKDKSTQLWASAIGWPPKPGHRSFAVATYSMHGARMLSEELCRRSNFFISSWVAAGSPAPFSFQDLAAAYQQAPEFRAWLDDLPLNSDCAKAALVIGDLIPLPVPA